MDERLGMVPDDIRRMGMELVERVAAYYGSLDTRPVYVPSTAAALRGMLAEPAPEEGKNFGEILRLVDSVLIPYSRHNGHPRFFGYISSPGTPVTAIGSMLAGALNINVTCWRSGPAATEMEHVVVGWLKEMLGYPADAIGLLTSGGSMANFAALAAARSAKAPGNVVRDGVGGPAMCCYVSSEGHFSIGKAAGMLGLGETNVRTVRANARQRIDLDDLARVVGEDRAAGRLPFCVVANAGTTATGAVDPIAALADFARKEDLWLHVDAAYGGFAALAPSARHLFAGIEQADSVALDPHKWLYLPVGCGSVLYKAPAAARAAFSYDADYTRTIGLELDEAFAFWDYGPELSRPFRALDLWLLIQYVGTRRLSEAIEGNIACAKHLERLVRESDDFEMLAPVELSIFCFRYKAATDTQHEQILVEVQRGGSSYLSNARVDGKFALRGCVINYRTTERDMEVLLDDVRKAARKVTR